MKSSMNRRKSTSDAHRHTTSRAISQPSSTRLPPTANEAAPQMHIRLNGAEPTTVPAPTVL